MSASLLFRRSRPHAAALRSVSFNPVPRAAVAGFHGSAVRPYAKESAGGQDSGKRAQELEHAKQEQKKEGGDKSHWREELSSDSEDAVKADRGETNRGADDIKKMQEQTEDKPREKHGQ